MTQEEKAKAYDEALKRIENLENTTSEEEAVINYIFPQLHESEDERIRKALIHLINEQDGFLTAINGISVKDIIAYLEKPKEQKPAEWSENESNLLDSIIEDYEKANRSFCGYDGKIGLLKAIRSGEYNLPKQEWSEEDSRILYNVIAYVGYAAGQRGVRDDEFKEANSWLKSLRPKPKHKQEEIVLCLEKGHPEPYKSVLILRHGNVVVEGEWNEEMGRWYQYGFKCYLEDNEVDGWMNKKSLLSGNSTFQLQWKPSEDQMEKLLATIECLENQGKNVNILNKLYADLKKL